jgi:hypothetical protein
MGLIPEEEICHRLKAVALARFHIYWEAMMVESIYAPPDDFPGAPSCPPGAAIHAVAYQDTSAATG